MEQQLPVYQTRIENVLVQKLAAHKQPFARLLDAMRYASLGGGKRLRASLVYLTGEMLGGSFDALDSPAASVEMIHSYSLIHDDLPCMDNADMRRGKPSCHIAFDEATAVLAGDALQALAFETIANTPHLSDATRIKMLSTLANACGPTGLVGGQSLDLDAVGGQHKVSDLEQMHNAKTGALITASIQLGALCSEACSDDELAALTEYGQSLGLAFQVVDDILDVTGNSETLGKTAGADNKLGKSTYTALLGIDGARAAATKHCAQALACLSRLRHNTEALKQLTSFVLKRQH